MKIGIAYLTLNSVNSFYLKFIFIKKINFMTFDIKKALFRGEKCD